MTHPGLYLLYNLLLFCLAAVYALSVCFCLFVLLLFLLSLLLLMLLCFHYLLLLLLFASLFTVAFCICLYLCFCFCFVFCVLYFVSLFLYLYIVSLNAINGTYSISTPHPPLHNGWTSEGGGGGGETKRGCELTLWYDGFQSYCFYKVLQLPRPLDFRVGGN